MVNHTTQIIYHHHRLHQHNNPVFDRCIVKHPKYGKLVQVGQWKDSALSKSSSSLSPSKSSSSPITYFNISSSATTSFEPWTSLSKSTKFFAESPWSKEESPHVSSSSWYLGSRNGFLELLIASICDVAEILAFLKQFTIVLVSTWSQALVSMYMVSRTLNSGMNLLLSKAIMMERTRMVRYFAFKLLIMLGSIDWMMEVVFFWHENNSHSFLILNMWMCWAIVNVQNQFLSFAMKLVI